MNFHDQVDDSNGAFFDYDIRGVNQFLRRNENLDCFIVMSTTDISHTMLEAVPLCGSSK